MPKDARKPALKKKKQDTTRGDFTIISCSERSQAAVNEARVASREKRKSGCGSWGCQRGRKEGTTTQGKSERGKGVPSDPRQGPGRSEKWQLRPYGKRGGGGLCCRDLAM